MSETVFNRNEIEEYNKPAVSEWTEELSEIDSANREQMESVKAASEKSGVVGHLALKRAQKNLKKFADERVDDLYDLAKYEGSMQDLEEWRRPKYLDEFTDNEIAGAKELLRLSKKYKADNADDLQRQLREDPDPDKRSVYYGFEGDSQEWAIEQLELTEGQLHRVKQAINALNGNPGYWGAPADPEKWRNRPNKAQ